MTVRVDVHELSAEDAHFFPAHGWIESAAGVKVVRLPIMRLYQWGEPTYKRFTDKNLAGTWLQARSPTRTLKQLGVCFCDLHREVREAVRIAELDLFDATPSPGRNDALSRQHESLDRLAVLIIAAFTLLRRLADELTDASRPLLFKKLGSAPGLMKKAILAARDGALARYEPICELEVLQDALCNRTAWFDRLRQEDGIRDILIHKPHFLQIGPGGTSRDGTNWDWSIHADLMRERPGPEFGLKSVDLFPELLECTRMACEFMQGLFTSVNGPAGDYSRGDVLSVLGMTDDIAGCWPPIRRNRTPFPIRERS